MTHCKQNYSPAAIECSALTAPTNGQVSYSTDMTEPFSIGTVATFTCDDDYTLNSATATLTCADDNQADTLGTWGGSEPSCLGNFMHSNYTLKCSSFKRSQSFLLINPGLIEGQTEYLRH